MKYLVILILLAAMPFNDIATINKHKKEAREAYNRGEYQAALTHYRYLVDSMNVDEPEVMLNYANTLYQLKDTTRAIERFASLYDTNDREVRSVANQQLGIIHNKLLKEPKAALQYFKQALKDNPQNEEARYNYEMLKKALKDQEEQQDQNKDEQEKDQEEKDQEQQNQDQQQEQKDQQQQDQEQQDQEQQEQDSDQKEQDQEGKESDQDQKSEDQESEDADKKEQEQPQGEPEEKQDQQQQDENNPIAEKLEDMKISEEKARMILEAMKNNEIQYFQQNKRKPTKKKDSSKPDW
jgi:hypothetical protein